MPYGKPLPPARLPFGRNRSQPFSLPQRLPPAVLPWQIARQIQQLWGAGGKVTEAKKATYRRRHPEEFMDPPPLPGKQPPQKNRRR